MERRAFSRLAGSALAGLGLPAGFAFPAEGAARLGRMAPRVDGARLNAWLVELSRFGANANGGVDRVAFSDADVEARAWTAELMRSAGLDVSVDLAGNLWGRREGTDPSLPPLALGSHIDSVPDGGNYDGPVGSLGAIEVALTLAEAGVRTRHPLHVVVFSNEEGGKTGSRALAGEVAPRELDLVTASGLTIGEGLRRIGGNPDRLERARLGPGALAGFLELHIEQGAVLESEGVDIGVVEGIVGIVRWTAVVEGETNHAGTTPMPLRRDALVGAARFVDAVHTTVRDWPGSQVATVGRLQVEPGAPNVIPGRATLSLEVRDLSMEKIEAVYTELSRQAAVIGEATGTVFSFDRFYTSGAAPTAPAFREAVVGAARALGLSTRHMPSGAGHDAQSMARICPMGMLFVPSAGGVSHAPHEYTSPEEVTRGADVLLGALLHLDAAGTGP